MLNRGTRAALGAIVLQLSACGAKTLDFSSPDGGSGLDARTDSLFGRGGSGGSISTTGAGGAAGGIDASSDTGTATGGAGGASTAGSGGLGGTGTGGSTIDGGTGATGGSGGSDGDGGTTLPFVTTSFREAKPSKVDLLLTIDNSALMSDKQALLAEAVPELVDRLVNPNCYDPITLRTIGRSIDGICAMGELEFAPVRDIHVGVISSSLGSHGASDVCDDAIDISFGRSDPHNNDLGHLIARGPSGATIPTFQNKGFLNYNPSLAGASTTTAALATPFTSMVRDIGQHGCGYEAPLEAAYRFLADPDPYTSVWIDTSPGGYGVAVPDGIDQNLLQQRAEFLRPDSVVAVVIMSDENDCSIIDGGTGFYALLPPWSGHSVLAGGTAICATNPNDPCCVNCNASSVPAGCPPTDQDPACQKGPPTTAEDPANLRCFAQKRRYGVDFLYPVSRYIDAFSGKQVRNRQGQLVANPLFSDLTCGGVGCASPRSKENVVVAGIVGVPWQDLSTNPLDASTLGGSGWLEATNGWSKIIGDPTNPSGPVPPTDPHMIESVQPRAGLAGPESAVNADPIHGHEWDTAGDPSLANQDLQYACTFSLPTPRECQTSEDCDCFGTSLSDTKNPLCQSEDGSYSTKQSRAKAYPGTRVLQVLQGLGNQALPGSICAAQTSDKTRSDYGYMPIVNRLVDRLSMTRLAKECLSVALPVDTTTHQTPCDVIEVFEPKDGVCNCNAEPGRIVADLSLLTDEMRAKGSCRCKIVQLNASQIDTCLTKLDATSVNGWCYVDPLQQNGLCDLVRECKIVQKRLVRFTNAQSEPRAGSTAFLRCDQLPHEPPRSAGCY